MAAPSAPLLEVRDLTIRIETPAGPLVPTDAVSYAVGRGEIVGLVGESGSGKTATALATLGLLPPRSTIVSGSIRFDGTELTTLPDREIRSIRGARIGYVPQDATTGLSPVLTVRQQLRETFEAHTELRHAAIDAKAVELLRSVGVPEPRERLRAYPHQLSGGLRQRVAIAIALSCEPELLIADEPTTALDVTTQAQVTELLAGEARRRNLGVLFISHDLSLVSSFTDRVLVMYAARIVEEGPTAAVTATPEHPYARGLLDATPRIGARTARLAPIPGRPPDLHHPPEGCRFHPRCPRVQGRCHEDDPQRLRPAVACWYPLDAAQVDAPAATGEHV